MYVCVCVWVNVSRMECRRIQYVHSTIHIRIVRITSWRQTHTSAYRIGCRQKPALDVYSNTYYTTTMCRRERAPVAAVCVCARTIRMCSATDTFRQQKHAHTERFHSTLFVALLCVYRFPWPFERRRYNCVIGSVKYRFIEPFMALSTWYRWTYTTWFYAACECDTQHNPAQKILEWIAFDADCVFVICWVRIDRLAIFVDFITNLELTKITYWIQLTQQPIPQEEYSNWRQTCVCMSNHQLSQHSVSDTRSNTELMICIVCVLSSCATRLAIVEMILWWNAGANVCWIIYSFE